MDKTAEVTITGFGSIEEKGYSICRIPTLTFDGVSIVYHNLPIAVSPNISKDTPFSLLVPINLFDKFSFVSLISGSLIVNVSVIPHTDRREFYCNKHVITVNDMNIFDGVSCFVQDNIGGV